MSLIPKLFDQFSPRSWECEIPRIGTRSQDIYSLFDSFSKFGIGQQISSELKSNQFGTDGAGFQTCIDVKQFKPNEIVVKVVNNIVVVEGKHEDREDEHGFVSRQFVRKYTLPESCDSKDVISTLSSDGILTIKVPSRKAIEGPNERVIQIQQT